MAQHTREGLEIDRDKALQDAEWLAGSTADSAERNLARAYLALMQENVDLWTELHLARRMARGDA